MHVHYPADDEGRARRPSLSVSYPYFPSWWRSLRVRGSRWGAGETSDGAGDADQAALVQDLGDLHGVGGRALEEVVADHPHLQPARMAGVAAQAPDEHLVATGAGERGRVAVGRRVVDELQAGRSLEQPARLLDGEVLARLERHRLGVAVAHGHARARDRDADVLVTEDLARLEHQLALLVGVVVAVGEVAGAAQDVERDRMRVDLGRRHRLAVEDVV